MKVNSKASNSLANVDSAKSQKLEGKKSTDKMSMFDSLGSTTGSSKINVSERAQMMQKAKDIASSQTVDEAKVARLQKMIDEGNYKVDADALADKLVDEHLMMPE